MPEYQDLYNKKKQKLKQKIIRGVQRPPFGTYRMIVRVMTVDDAGSILLTRRAPEKTYAGKWEITGGCVQAGEDSSEAAVRELREETGLSANPEELEYRGDLFGPDYIFDYYLLRWHGARPAIRLQTGETSEARWVTPREFYELFRGDQTVTRECVHFFEKYAEVLKPALNEG